MDEESSFKRKLLIVALVIALAIGGQLWWNRAHPGKSSPVMDAIAKVMPASANKTVVEAMNFSYTKPDNSWTVTDGTPWGSVAVFSMTRPSPITIFAIFAYTDGGEEVSVKEQMAKLAAPRTNKLFGSQSSEPVPHRVNGMEGLRYEETGTNLYGVGWVYAVNGYRYTLRLQGRPDQKSEIAAQADSLFRGFSLLDPARHATPKETATWRNFKSPHGYRVEAKADHWGRYTGLEKLQPAVEFGLLSQEKGGLMTFAADLMGVQPGKDALAEACLGLAGIRREDLRPTVAKEAKEGPWTGTRLSFERQTEQTNLLYQHKLLRGSNLLFYAIAWVDKSHAAPAAFLEQTLALVTLPDAEPAAPPNPEPGDTRDRRLQGELMNGLGRYYEKARQPTPARAYFRRAFEARPERSYLVSFLDASVAAGQFEDTLKYLEEHATAVTREAEFQARRAYLQARCGKGEAALKNYTAAFEAGLKSEPMLMDYLRLLVHTGRAELAAAKLDKYLKEKDTLELRLVQSALLREQKKFAEAIAMLKEQEKRYSFNPALSRELVDCYYDAGRHKDAIEECARLLAKGQDTADTHVAKARNELALKAYRQAKVSLEIALEKDPGNAAAREYMRQIPGADK